MKKHLSVLGLFARSSLCKVILILIAMCAVEAVFFYLELQKALDAYTAVESSFVSLENLFSRAATNVYFRVALVLVSIVISLPGCAFKSNTSYTLRRLSVSEQATFFHQAAYNTMIYTILTALQLTTVFLLSLYYVRTAPGEYVSSQTLFLAFHRNSFLHSLLPLQDIGLWIRNVLLIISFGLATAEFPFLQRRGKFSSSAIALCAYTVVYFDQGIAQLAHVITTGIIAILMVSSVIYQLKKGCQEVSEDA